MIYDKHTGAEYFDAAGSRAGEQIQFAQLDACLPVINKDVVAVRPLADHAVGGATLVVDLTVGYVR